MPLFELIKSMSPAEKKHFKLYSGTDKNGKPPRYVELFDLIEGRKIYDDSLITKKGFKLWEKTPLYEKIDASLHVLSLNPKKENEYPDIRVKWLLGRMKRLYDRGLWKDLKKCIDKAKQLARQHELYLDWLAAIQWEKKWFIEYEDSKMRYERYTEIMEEEDKIRRIIDEEINYRNLREQVNTLRIKDPKFEDVKVKKELKKIVQSGCLDEKHLPCSPKAKADFYFTKSVLSKNADESCSYAQKAVEVFEQGDFSGAIVVYRRYLGLLCEQYARFGKYAQIPEVIEKIKSLPLASDYETEPQYWHGLVYALNCPDKEKGEEYIEVIEGLLEKYKHKIRQGRQVAYFYNISIFYCLFGEWEKAHTWINKIFKSKLTDDRKDLQYGPRLVRFMIAYEIEYELDNYLQATTKYLKKHKKYTPTYEYIISAFNKLNNSINQDKEKREIFIELDRHLKQMNVDEKKSGEMEEFHLWCKSKLQKVTMAEVVRQQQKKASATA